MVKLDFDEVTVDPMGNLIGRIGSGPRIIALDGHVDTVDVGDRSLWDREPLSGDIEDGILYGRGTSDMKGGVASSVYAGGLIKKRGIPDDVTLYVTATVQEEDCDGLCWQYIAKEDGIRPELVVITERLMKTGAKLIFATTTPYPEGVRPRRDVADAVRYNAVARKVMAARGVAINDLYAFAKPRLARLQQPKNVHFSPQGSSALARRVVKEIRAAMKTRK